MIRLVLLLLAVLLPAAWSADVTTEYPAVPVPAPATVASTAASTATTLLGILGVLGPVLIAIGKVVTSDIAAKHPALAGLAKPGSMLADVLWSLLASKTHIQDDTAIVTRSAAFQSVIGVIHGAQTDPAAQAILQAILAKLPSTEADAVKAALAALGPAPAILVPAQNAPAAKA